MNRYIIIMIIAFSAFHNVQAQEKDHSKAAQDFSYEGCGFGMTVSDFLVKHSKKSERNSEQSEPKNKLIVFDMENVKGADLAKFYFYDNELYRIQIFYLPDTLDKIGGWVTVAERLVEKFGKPDGKSSFTDELVEVIWRFPDVDKFIQYKVLPDVAVVEAADVKRYDKYTEEKKKKADLGF